jgi:hypothetical protein
LVDERLQQRCLQQGNIARTLPSPAMTAIGARFSLASLPPQLKTRTRCGILSTTPHRLTTSGEGGGHHQITMPWALASGSSCCRSGSVNSAHYRWDQVPHREREIRPAKAQIGSRTPNVASWRSACVRALPRSAAALRGPPVEFTGRPPPPWPTIASRRSVAAVPHGLCPTTIPATAGGMGTWRGRQGGDVGHPMRPGGGRTGVEHVREREKVSLFLPVFI